MHNPRYEHHRLDWNGILIEVRYCGNWSPSFEEIYGHGMSHIELESLEPARAALPITETGYRSHFAPAPDIEEGGGPVAYVIEALELAAADPRWKEREAAARQMSLF